MFCYHCSLLFLEILSAVIASPIIVLGLPVLGSILVDRTQGVLIAVTKLTWWSLVVDRNSPLLKDAAGWFSIQK
jgi:hypothetical protein